MIMIMIMIDYLQVEVLKKPHDLLSRIPSATLPLHLGGTCDHNHDAWLHFCISNFSGYGGAYSLVLLFNILFALMFREKLENC